MKKFTKKLTIKLKILLEKRKENSMKLILDKKQINLRNLKVVSATFLLVCFVSLKGSTFETRKNVFYLTSKALFVHEIIRF